MSDRFGTPTAPDRPSFTVVVDGTELAAAQVRDVTEIDLDERVNGHAIAQLLLRNWDPKTREPLYSNQELFKPGANIAVSVGYQSELFEVFDGVITAMTVRFPPEGIGVLAVEARSRSARLSTSSRHRSFEDLNTADRFAAIAQDHGLSADVGDGDLLETVYDEGTDWQRVLNTASALGWVGYVRGEQLVLRPPSTDEPTITMTYGTNLLELTLTEDLARRSNPIVVASWNSDDQTALEAESSTTGVAVGDRSDLATALSDADLSVPSRRLTVADHSAQSEVDQRADGAARIEQLRHRHGLAMSMGLPQLRCDAWIELAGTGTHTDGPHYVSRVRHRIGAGGYTTEFTLGLPEELRPPTVTVDASMSGPSLVIGVVTDIADPQSSGRVKIVVPIAGDEADAVWARVATLDAGADHGTVFTPSVGNEVVVGFVGRDPVIVGQLHSGAHPPGVEIDTDANTLRGLTTPSGHALIFDDDTPLVKLVTGGGQTAVLDDDAGSITLTESGGNSVTISGDGITLEAASGDLTLKASSGTIKMDAAKIEGSATGPSKLESSATLDISASATLGLSGALVNIN